ncbi:unnamed protein product [Prunus armeniaca]
MIFVRRANPFFTNFARRTVCDETSVAHNYVRLKSFLRDEDPFVAQSLKCSSASKYCAFHGTHGHTTNNCFAWKAHLEELMRKGHCTEFIAKQAI